MLATILAAENILTRKGWIDVNPFGQNTEKNIDGFRDGTIRIPTRHINNLESVMKSDFPKITKTTSQDSSVFSLPEFPLIFEVVSQPSLPRTHVH